MVAILAMTTAGNHGDNDGDNHDHDGADNLPRIYPTGVDYLLPICNAHCNALPSDIRMSRPSHLRTGAQCLPILYTCTTGLPIGAALRRVEFLPSPDTLSEPSHLTLKGANMTLNPDNMAAFNYRAALVNIPAN